MGVIFRVNWEESMLRTPKTGGEGTHDTSQRRGRASPHDCRPRVHTLCGPGDAHGHFPMICH